jgi:signal transduction histidine kinase
VSVLRRIPGQAIDWVIVAAFLVLIGREALTFDAFAGGRVAAALFVAGFVVPFGLRRRWPFGALVVSWGSAAIGSVAVASFFFLESPFPLALYSAYIAGVIPAPRRSLAGLAAVLGGLAVVNLTHPDTVAGDWLFPGGFIVGLWAVTRTLHNRALLAAELHEAAARAADRREEAAARAVVEERRRIAREMHDLVGHSISVMVVQAGGARRILDRDPDRAVEAAVRIEATGREALAEMRRLLGLLGGDDDGGDPAYDPQPTLDSIAPLVARARDAGVEVAFVTEGERRPLPQGAEVAAYRIVQEALTNVLKHAGAAPTAVALRWGEDALELEVADRGTVSRQPAEALPGTGHGIAGMRERVRVYGGELDAGPDAGGGFVVRARIPYGQGELVAA